MDESIDSGKFGNISDLIRQDIEQILTKRRLIDGL